MNSTLVIGAAVAMLISQGLLVRAVLFSQNKNPACEAAPLSAEVKSYIDSHSPAGVSGDEMAALFKKIADLEQEAGRLEYLRSTLTTLEEAQLRLGKSAQDAPTTVNELIASARERELLKFRVSVEDLCSPSVSGRGGNSLQKAKAPFLMNSTPTKGH